MLKEGDKVRLIYLNRIGYVADYIDDEMILVEVDGDEIPVFMKHLELMTDEMELTSVRITRDKQVIKEEQKERFEQGIYLAFLPLRSTMEEITEFKLYLVNHLPYSLLGDFTFLLENRDIFRWKKQLGPHSFHPLNKIAFDKLNDSPAALFKFWVREKQEGRVQHFERLLKIKPRNFFKKNCFIPLMEDVQGFVFEVVKDIPLKKEKPKGEPLTKEHFFKVEGQDAPSRVDVVIKANLPSEIDLHIDKLVKDHKDLSNREMLRIQLDRCEKYLGQAIINGFDRVYLIHGVGKGRLREEVWNILAHYDHVTGYRNEYHPRYGYGATEVDLG